MGYAKFQLLELSLISAQDLAPVSKKLRTYAIAWVNPERKLRTRIDQQGQVNPTWNDKFVFRVDDQFLNSDSSAVMIEIYALGWLKDINVGTIRVLISNLLPPSVRAERDSSKRFVALQIRRRSGRPHGILNMGVSLLDNTMRTMPLYTELSASAVGFEDVDVKLYKQQDNRRASEQKLGGPKEGKEVKKIQLRRNKSDQTGLATLEKVSKGIGSSNNHAGGCGSACNGSSMVNGSMYASSLNGDSIVNGSELCASDIGPSPSVVAAAVARGLILTPLGVPRDPGSSILGDWKIEESDVEGLKSKIERWRTEFPAQQTLQNNNNSSTNRTKSKKSSPLNKRTPVHKSNSGGFTCFAKVFGCEFTIVCGGNANRKRNSRSKNLVCDSELTGSSILSRT